MLTLKHIEVSRNSEGIWLMQNEGFGKDPQLINLTPEMLRPMIEMLEVVEDSYFDEEEAETDG